MIMHPKPFSSGGLKCCPRCNITPKKENGNEFHNVSFVQCFDHHDRVGQRVHQKFHVFSELTSKNSTCKQSPYGEFSIIHC